MYIPSRFASPSDDALEEVVRAHPFATLITGEEVSHVPLVLEKRGRDWTLLGHFARGNPHAKALLQRDSLAIFHGPQSYVTPLWYESADVPTWNYVVAHLRGRARLLEKEEEIVRVLQTLTEETEGPSGWRFRIPDDLAEPGALAKAIVGFEIRVEERAGKFKLSQNRDPADVAGVLRGLSTRKDEGSQSVLRWMKRWFSQE